MKNFNKKIFLIATIVFAVLLIPSILAIMGEEEGTLGKSFVWSTFAKLFHILRFPTHTLFWSLIAESYAIVYFIGLMINCMIYGLITERLLFILKRLINQKK